MKAHLILDEASVAHHAGVTFRLNPATRHRQNPVLLPGESHEWDSLQVSWPGTVLYDAEAPGGGLFRCWYSGMDALQSERVQPCPWVCGYAESRDGVNWEKPPLGQVQHHGADTNRITAPFRHWFLSTVWFNPVHGDPKRRFLGLWTWREESGAWGKDLASSPDGKAWMRELTPHQSAGRMGMHDISQVVYDENASDPDYRVLAYAQFNDLRADGTFIRIITVLHGASERRLVADADCVALAPEPGVDEELHFAAVLKIGDAWLMLFESDRFSGKPLHGDLRLAVSDGSAGSAGGRQFLRIHKLDALVPTGSRGMWDENMLVTTTAAMQEVGDEVFIYYFGCPNVYRNWPASYAVSPERRGSMFYPTYLGLATLPRDRFACAEGPGSVTLDIDAGGEGVWLNVDGDVEAIEAADGKGDPMAAGKLGTRRLATVYRHVEWHDAPPRGQARLTVKLPRGARLYSVRA